MVLLEQQQEAVWFMEHAMDVLMACAGDAEAMAAVRSMAEMGRSLLVGGIMQQYVYDDLLQHYMELHARVKASCSGDGKAAAALAAMQAAVRPAANSG
jgi:hypothetical protein